MLFFFPTKVCKCIVNHNVSIDRSENTMFTLSSVQFSRPVMYDSVSPWTAAYQATLSITNSRSLPKLVSIESVMPSNHLILYCPLFVLPSIFPSIWVFSNESALCIWWPKSWSFSNSPSHEYSGLISFRIYYFDLLAVQRTLKESSLIPQFKSINPLVFSSYIHT